MSTQHIIRRPGVVTQIITTQPNGIQLITFGEKEYVVIHGDQVTKRVMAASALEARTKISDEDQSHLYLKVGG